MNAIEIKDLSIRRGDFTLGPLDLSVEEGEVFAILGQTGAGKTVLLETLAGFYQNNYRGSIELFGADASLIPAGDRKTGFVYQDYGLFPHMTVEENIAYGLKMHKIPKSVINERIDYITKLLSIDHIRELYPAVISGGERQRTALSRALALNPKILLLDEPFSALDPGTRIRMYKEIQRIHDEFECTIIFVTHDFSEAQTLANRIGILLAGKLRAVVKTEELFEQAYDDDVKIFLGVEND